VARDCSPYLQGMFMPYVNLRLIDDQISAEKKLAIIEGFTNVLVEVLGKDPATTFVLSTRFLRRTGEFTGRALQSGARPGKKTKSEARRRLCDDSLGTGQPGIRTSGACYRYLPGAAH
jgi:4-oxalocrotonate tautomerase